MTLVKWEINSLQPLRPFFHESLNERCHSASTYRQWGRESTRGRGMATCGLRTPDIVRMRIVCSSPFSPAACPYQLFFFVVLSKVENPQHIQLWNRPTCPPRLRLLSFLKIIFEPNTECNTGETNMIYAKLDLLKSLCKFYLCKFCSLSYFLTICLKKI